MSYDKHKIDDIEQGVKVRFTGKGGYSAENTQANQQLKVNDVYTVRYVEVNNWNTDVYLEGYERSFNSVMFEVASELFN